MRSIILKVCLLILCGFIADSSAQNPSGSTGIIRFTTIDMTDDQHERVFSDFDSDGREEFVFQGGNKRLGALLMNFDGPNARSSCHLRGVWHVAQIRAHDVVGDPSPEILLCLKDEDTTWVEVYEVFVSQGEPHCSLVLKTEAISGPDRNKDGRWDGNLDHCASLDVNGDDQKDVLASINVGYDGTPRGVFAFDGVTGKILWRFLTAGPPQRLLHLDVDADGHEEILFGTWGPANLFVQNDMDDSHGYLICITENGELLWKQEMGGVYYGPKYVIGDLDKDEQSEIVTTYASGDPGNESTHYELQIREADSGKVVKYYPLPAQFGQPFLADLDRDNKVEIIVGSELGTILVFDHQLDSAKTYSPATGTQWCEVAEVTDVNQDGELEIIACNSQSILILNRNLELLATHETCSRPDAGRTHFFEHPYHKRVLSAIQGYGQCHSAWFFRLDPVTGTEKAVATVYQYGFVSVIVVFLLGTVVALAAARMLPLLARKLRSLQAQKVAENRGKLVLALSTFGHGKTATSNLDRLNFLFKNLPMNQTPSQDYRRKLDETVKAYFDFTSQQLANIIAKSKSAKTETEHPILLEENSGKLRALLSRYVNEGIKPNQINRLSQVIPELVESLETNIESLWNEVARYYSCDIIASVQEVLAAVSPEMRNQRIELKSLQIEGEVGTPGFIAKSDFATIFEELINNAMYSLRESLKRELAVRISIDERKILVDVTDTGCGIQAENFDKIFNREYSTKQEGGFGLYHAKSTINQYGGKIKVAESRPGVGTTIRVEVKRI